MIKKCLGMFLVLLFCTQVCFASENELTIPVNNEVSIQTIPVSNGKVLVTQSKRLLSAFGAGALIGGMSIQAALTYTTVFSFLGAIKDKSLKQSLVFFGSFLGSSIFLPYGFSKISALDKENKMSSNDKVSPLTLNIAKSMGAVAGSMISIAFTFAFLSEEDITKSVSLTQAKEDVSPENICVSL